MNLPNDRAGYKTAESALLGEGLQSRDDEVQNSKDDSEFKTQEEAIQ